MNIKELLNSPCESVISGALDILQDKDLDTIKKYEVDLLYIYYSNDVENWHLIVKAYELLTKIGYNN